MSEKIIGQVLKNQFRVDEFIGSGSMSVVYRVWDLKRNTPLAMKILQSELADDPSMFKYFQRGANALKKLAHPHIVPFYGLERTDAFAFALEGYIKGPNVKDILRQQGKQPLPLLDALCVMKAVCSALGYAHANGVVHCDVKPGNIMVDAGGNVYLTDFGIARHADSTTTTMGAAGTPAYMAPEQIRGEAVNAATDVYAMGIMLYEMVTGRRPFEGKDLKTSSSETGATQANLIRTAHLTQPPPDPRGLNPKITAEMAEVILKALEKSPQDRYRDIMVFFNAFCAAAGVSTDQIPERLLKYVREAEAIPAPVLAVGIRTGGQFSIKKALPFILGGAGLVVALILVFTLKKEPEPTAAVAINPTHTLQAETATARSPTETSKPTLTPTQAPPTHTPMPTLSPTPVLPTVVIEPRCEEQDLSPVTIRAHQPVTLWWHWDTLTPQQAQDHLDAVHFEIYLDGVFINPSRQTDILYVPDEGVYRVSWYAEVGALPTGTHLASRLWEWSTRIFDGWDYYGPGTSTVSEYHECVIIVRPP